MKINQRLALKLIKKLPISKEQKEEVKKGVLSELDRLKELSESELKEELKPSQLEEIYG